MNPLLLFLLGCAAFFFAGRVYSGLLEKALGVDPQRPTPAMINNDGRDFVPTKSYVLFAHHFSAIAGAGPILGPTMVLLYGYAPAWMWIVCGSIFFGAAHDFSALFVSVREGGRSMADIARTTLGSFGFLLFISFAIIMLLLVVSNFLAATAISLTSQWPLEKLGLAADQSLLRVVLSPSGERYGVIGGIASTSVVIITLAAPLFGYALYKAHMSARIAYPCAALLCIGSIAVGFYWPISADPHIWMVILSVYVFLAASLPVWVILQPRDFINVQILYVGLVALTGGLLIAGIDGRDIAFPAFQLSLGKAQLGPIWPMLFITVACGAISGFHALVAGGTTAKQISSEGRCKHIGYYGMLLEGLLALLVLLAMGSTLGAEEYRRLVWPTAAEAAISPSNPILAFSLGVGRLLDGALSIPPALGTVFGILLVEGFVITTLDAAVRLTRYLFEELWAGLFGERVPSLLRNAHFNTLIIILIMCVLAFTNSFQVLWPLFGTGNQLLAALTLTVVSVWLLVRGRNPLYTVLPAAFMMCTTIASLCLLIRSYVKSENYLLLGAALILIALALGTLVITIKKAAAITRSRQTAREPVAGMQN